MADYGRNEDCFCGSGTKYKRCCAPMRHADYRAMQDAAGTARRVKDTRIVYDDGETRHVLFKLTASSFGGLILTFPDSETLSDWRYGPVDHPAGESSTGTMGDGERVEVGTAPKLHYHPSGHISMNQDSQPETHPRRSLQATPMVEVNDRHVITVMLTEPAQFPVPAGKRDSDLGISGAGAKVVKVVGKFHPLSGADPKLLAIPANPFAVPGHNSSNGKALIVARLDHYGVPVYATLELHRDPDHFKPVSTGSPQALGIMFDARTMGDASKSARTLGVWNVHQDEVAE